jgi:VWFA-related protein
MSRLLLLVCLTGAVVLADNGQQRPGAFRSSVTLVPVEVRVLDAQGEPITDLAAADFEIVEDDARQEIAHFSTGRLVPEPDLVGEAPRLRAGPGLGPPAAHRTFAIVLGRGRLQGPAKGMDAVIEFVRDRLLPQDQIAVLAYGRATALSTDHEAVIALLQRYRDRHEDIEARLDGWFSGMQALFGSRENPPGLQAEIDELFEAPGLPKVRDRLDVNPPENSRLDQARQYDREMAMGGAGTSEVQRALYEPFGFEQYEQFLQLFSAIEELRYLDGQKHLIFVTETAVGGPEPTHTDSLASVAADARVAVWILGTGGLAGYFNQTTGFYHSTSLGGQLIKRDSHAASQQTGGLAWFHQDASGPMDRIDRATRFSYVLGYYPSNQDWDGAFRRIRVNVNRPDVTVLYRHGYYAREELVPYDRRRFLSYNRITLAAATPRRVRDVTVAVSGRVTSREEDNRRIEVEVTIDPSAVQFDRDGNDYVAALDLAVFVADAGEKPTGTLWDQIDLRLDAATFARLARESILYTGTVSLSGPARHVKAVVYDYSADRVGTATTEVY